MIDGESDLNEHFWLSFRMNISSASWKIFERKTNSFYSFDRSISDSVTIFENERLEINFIRLIIWFRLKYQLVRLETFLYWKRCVRTNYTKWWIFFETRKLWVKRSFLRKSIKLSNQQKRRFSPDKNVHRNIGIELSDRDFSSLPISTKRGTFRFVTFEKFLEGRNQRKQKFDENRCPISNQFDLDLVMKFSVFFVDHSRPTCENWMETRPIVNEDDRCSMDNRRCSSFSWWKPSINHADRRIDR